MRTLSILFTALVLGSCGGFLSILALPNAGFVEEVPREVALDLLEREVEVAKALGFTVHQRGEGVPLAYELPLNGGCGAFVMTVSGPKVEPTVSVEDALWPNQPELARGSSALNVTHVQVCAVTSALRVLPKVPEARRGLYLDDTTAHWVALTGSVEQIGGNAALNRGSVPKDVEPFDAGVPDDESDEMKAELDRLLREVDAATKDAGL